ncbi:TPA: recombinase family protein [Klebsiella pneumoniae]|uniref:recombinase family protein n=2 Tax=cellular organisms TaxID=131567 RepID=UPI001D0D062B|nr:MULTISPECIES: recombinase family protein [Klebsiella]MCL7665728.1 recombinase family protein [Klebsiella pneumoniae]MCM6406757.1 recombinase family protein [Klebsiella pneumoniae]
MATIMRYGYARTSTKEQNPERQRVALQEEDCEELFVDQCSGKNAERPQLQLMMSKLRAGDTVVVKSVDRLARNTKDLLALLDEAKNKGAQVRFIDNRLTFDDSPTSNFMITMLGAVGELERSFIRQRQSEGIEIAKSNNVYKGRPVSKKTEAAKVKIAEKLARGVFTDKEIYESVKVSRASFYRIKKEIQTEQ